MLECGSGFASSSASAEHIDPLTRLYKLSRLLNNIVSSSIVSSSSSHTMASVASTVLLVLALSAASLAYPYPGYGDYGYYHPGSEHRQGDRYGSDAERYGAYDKGAEGYRQGWKSGDHGHYNGDFEKEAHENGDGAWNDGKEYYNAEADKGHKHAAGEHGDRAAEDAEGSKKYSYFSEGSGPQGYYKKGYFGSEGYDHESAQAHEVKDAHGNGFAKASQNAEKEHSGKKSAFEKAGGAKGAKGNDYEQHESGYKLGEIKHALEGQGHHASDSGDDFKFGAGYGHH
uniref:Abscisic stress ripening protein n=1 Tax=Steinernema glaseri TaxID=37863 RepID=A0A1I8AHI0_9BILA